MIEFGPGTCGNLDQALGREWLETNGIGGFASSTIAGVNTRRYHALLTAALENPPGRFVLLSKLETTLLANGSRYPLSANIYPGAVHPQGFRMLPRFRLDPFPVFTHEAAGRTIEQRITMAREENTTVIEYRLLSGDACGCELLPLIAFRGYHELTHKNEALSSAVTHGDGTASIQPYSSLPRLFFSFTRGAEFLESAGWFYNFVYPREQERGLDFEEDLYSPFGLSFEFRADEPVRIVASTEADRSPDSLAPLFDRERERRRALSAGAPAGDDLAATLFEASDAFTVQRANGEPTVIAGYHWFTDWGRDTMISLPGLTLATRRFDIARRILIEWARSLDRGMLPNRFPDSGAAPEYNTVDAALWLFEAARKYVEYTGDLDFVRKSLYEPMMSIIDWYMRGTRFGIRADSDGLVIGGGEGTQLTWMDAMVNGRPATPRHGKPVEIQALWFNALRMAEDLSREFSRSEDARRCGSLAQRLQQNFAMRFWNEDAGCLFDVIDQPDTNAQIRPNQIFALSLGYPLIMDDKARAILAVVERDLLTPFGLRTLAPSDPQYRARYRGGVPDRDSAYHNGTVWPWLLGHFITAYLRAYNHDAGAIARAKSWLAPFESHLRDAGLGFISEIFDGDAPHDPRGCIAQAWSVAEILRARLEVPNL